MFREILKWLFCDQPSFGTVYVDYYPLLLKDGKIISNIRKLLIGKFCQLSCCCCCPQSAFLWHVSSPNFYIKLFSQSFSPYCTLYKFLHEVWTTVQVQMPFFSEHFTVYTHLEPSSTQHRYILHLQVHFAPYGYKLASFSYWTSCSLRNIIRYILLLVHTVYLTHSCLAFSFSNILHF